METTAREAHQGKLGQIVYETMTMERFLAVQQVAKEFGMMISKASEQREYQESPGGAKKMVEIFTGHDQTPYRVPVGHVHARIDNPEGKDWAEFWQRVAEREVAPPAHI